MTTLTIPIFVDNPDFGGLAGLPSQYLAVLSSYVNHKIRLMGPVNARLKTVREGLYYEGLGDILSNALKSFILDAPPADKIDDVIKSAFGSFCIGRVSDFASKSIDDEDNMKKFVYMIEAQIVLASIDFFQEDMQVLIKLFDALKKAAKRFDTDVTKILDHELDFDLLMSKIFTKEEFLKLNHVQLYDHSFSCFEDYSGVMWRVASLYSRSFDNDGFYENFYASLCRTHFSELKYDLSSSVEKININIKKYADKIYE